MSTIKSTTTFSLGAMVLFIGVAVYAVRLEARIDVHQEHLTGVDKILAEQKAQDKKVIEQYVRIGNRLARIEGALGLRHRQR